MSVPFSSPRLPRRPRSLGEAVVEHVKEQISSGALKPHDKLPTESSLMETLGVSRTVVREAVSRLQEAGLVETRHGIGSFVLEPRAQASGIALASASTLYDVMAMLELRICIETECAGLAAQRASAADLQAMAAALEEIGRSTEDGRDGAVADRQFHLCIARSSGNRYFVDILSQLGTALIPRNRVDSARIAHAAPSDYVTLINREHENVYEAISRKDPEAARAAMRMHLSNSRERLRRAHESREAQAAPR